MANQDFISNLHEGFNFPLDLLREYIEKNVGVKAADFKKITKGYDSEVYDIGEFFVKIRREGDVTYECIKWAVEQCVGVKTAKIFHCGKISGTARCLDFLYLLDSLLLIPIITKRREF
ncbi:MAG: hypothetical protein FWB80_01765 [Defluviitaleaceae bacterium]|nr:hypothetical protein [Defluviitaleaceae bacterium]